MQEASYTSRKLGNQDEGNLHVTAAQWDTTALQGECGRLKMSVPLDQQPGSLRDCREEGHPAACSLSSTVREQEIPLSYRRGLHSFNFVYFLR